jgi:hypothetical protein
MRPEGLVDRFGGARRSATSRGHGRFTLIDTAFSAR